MPPLTERNHLIRAQHVTASEVGALLGEHPYTTPEAIWDRLMERGPEREPPSQSMRLGSYMEGPILRWYAQEKGVRVKANSRSLVHRTVRLCATPDAYIVGGGLVEVKLSGRTDLWARTPPDYVIWQAMAQLAVTNRDYCDIAVLIGATFRIHTVYRDPLAEVMMTEAVTAFWDDHIRMGRRPEPTTREVVLR